MNGLWFLVFGLWLALVAGCGSARVEVVDAISGVALDATVRELADGRLLVEASGYEMRVAVPGERVTLAPLWQARFMDPGERPPPRPLRDHPACCPGKKAQ